MLRQAQHERELNLLSSVRIEPVEMSERIKVLRIRREKEKTKGTCNCSVNAKL
jgi:hypothetical protein